MVDLGLGSARSNKLCVIYVGQSHAHDRQGALGMDAFPDTLPINKREAASRAKHLVERALLLSLLASRAGTAPSGCRCLDRFTAALGDSR